MPAQFTKANSLSVLLTSLSSPPVSPTGPLCHLIARSRSSIRTDCWSPSPGDIPQSTEPPLCLHQTLCSGVHWSEEKARGECFLERHVVLCNNWEHHEQNLYMMPRSEESQTCPYIFSSTSRYVLAQRLRNHTMSLPIWGLSSCVRLALVARDSTSEVRSTADSNLWWTNAEESQRKEILENKSWDWEKNPV